MLGFVEDVRAAGAAFAFGREAGAAVVAPVFLACRTSVLVS